MGARGSPGAKGPSYQGYLEVEKLLRLQKPLSEPSSHDELLFIVTHQTFELWFKVVLRELDEAYEMMVGGDALEATRALGRVAEIEDLLIRQLRILESMRPTDFLKFRNLLGAASGLQSLQYREIEFVSGLKDERFLLPHGFPPRDLEKARRRLEGPTLWDGFRSILEREGFHLGLTTEEGKLDGEERSRRTLEREARAVAEVYSSGRHPELVGLAEALITHDENFVLWRCLHMAMAERMIGRKPGTGHAEAAGITGLERSGVEYLQSTQTRRFFPTLWSARTLLGKG